MQVLRVPRGLAVGIILFIVLVSGAEVWAQAPSKPQESEQTQTSSEGEMREGPKTAEPKSPTPVDPAPPAKGFKPSEKIRADSAVSFPVDI